VVLVCSYSRR